MAFTQAQRDNLANAIARGIRSVSYEGVRTDYMSLEEMRSLLTQMDAELADAAGTNVTRQVLVKTKKGIGP